jgi:hypothetical protein
MDGDGTVGCLRRVGSVKGGYVDRGEVERIDGLRLARRLVSSLYLKRLEKGAYIYSRTTIYYYGCINNSIYICSLSSAGLGSTAFSSVYCIG